MNDTAKVAAAVAGGYLLGRTKKMKMAVGLAMWFAGRKMKTRPSWMLADALQQLASSDEVSRLREQFSGEMVSTGKKAAGAVLTTGVGRLADSLADRTAALGLDGGQAEETVKGAGGKARDTAEGLTGRGKGKGKGKGKAEDVDEDRADEDEEPEEGSVDEAEDREGDDEAEDREGDDEDREAEDVYPEERRGGERKRASGREGSRRARPKESSGAGRKPARSGSRSRSDRS